MGPATKTTKPRSAGRMNRNPNNASCLRNVIEPYLSTSHVGRATTDYTDASSMPEQSVKSVSSVVSNLRGFQDKVSGLVEPRYLLRGGCPARYFAFRASLAGLLMA